MERVKRHHRCVASSPTGPGPDPVAIGQRADFTRKSGTFRERKCRV